MGITKNKIVKYWDDIRWIGILSAFQKWFMKTIRSTYISQITPTLVQSFNYKKGSSPDRAVSMLRQMAVAAHGFGTLLECLGSVWHGLRTLRCDLERSGGAALDAI